MNTIQTTELHGFTIIRTREQHDTQAENGQRNRQFKVRIKKGTKTIKNSYFSTKKDRDIAYRGFIFLIKEGANS